MFIRPATIHDQEGVLALARQAGFGMTSLPPDTEVLHAKIAASVASFNGTGTPGQEAFLFVLEDSDNGQIAGTCGVVAHVGLKQPFYSYKLTTITQASQQLNVFSKHSMLQVTNDLTGASEIGSLFLNPDYRRDRIGKLLSLSRFMFIAAFPAYFADQVIAEMRGVHDSEGNAPFYNAVARHFFQMPFAQADYINATQGNQFINDLMPKYPIYLSLLPKSAQKVVGQVNPASEPAKYMLEKQNFRYTGYVDIFDGGTTLVADRAQIKTIRESGLRTVQAIEIQHEDAPRFMFSNDRFDQFRCTMGRAQLVGSDAVIISAKTAERLQLATGDTVRIGAI
jgi:arginine N-succinyltransferase